MKITISESDLRFIVSCMKQLERMLSEKKQDPSLVERITSVLEKELLKT